MSAPTTEAISFENYPQEADPSAPADVALPVAATPATSEEWFPWWGYLAILLGGVVFCVMAMIAWVNDPAILRLTTPQPVQYSNEIQPKDPTRDTEAATKTVTDLASECLESQELARVQYSNHLACVDKKLYSTAHKAASQKVEGWYKEGHTQFAEWAKRQGFAPKTLAAKDMVLKDYLCEGDSTFAGRLYVARELQPSLRGARGVEIEGILFNMRLSSPTKVADSVCSVRPGWQQNQEEQPSP